MLGNTLSTRTASGKVNMFTIYILLVHSKQIQDGIVLLSSSPGRETVSQLTYSIEWMVISKRFGLALWPLKCKYLGHLIY